MNRRPADALLMLILLLSLAGIPPMAGFYGKYFIFLALLEAGQYVLAIFAALYVAVATYYYFRIIRAIFLTEEVQPAAVTSGWGTKVALVVCGAFTIIIGLYPEPFIRLASNSILLTLR